jgi:hypothetical protein
MIWRAGDVDEGDRGGLGDGTGVSQASLPKRGAKAKNGQLFLEARYFFANHNITWRALRSLKASPPRDIAPPAPLGAITKEGLCEQLKQSSGPGQKSHLFRNLIRSTPAHGKRVVDAALTLQRFDKNRDIGCR